MHEKQQWRWILFHLLHEILREVFIRDLRVHSMTSCYLIWAWVAESMENLGKTQIEQSRKIVKTRETYLDCMDETVQRDWLQYRWFGKERKLPVLFFLAKAKKYSRRTEYKLTDGSKSNNEIARNYKVGRLVTYVLCNIDWGFRYIFIRSNTRLSNISSGITIRYLNKNVRSLYSVRNWGNLRNELKTRT